MGCRVCPKCLNYEGGPEKYCVYCGNSLADWELKCTCGAKLSPLFGFSQFLRIRQPKPLYKYCPSCGALIVDRFKMYTRAIQLLKK